MDIIRDGTGRIIPMGTQVTSAEGFTILQVLNEEGLHCRFEVELSDGSEIKLTFQDYDLAETLIKAAVNDELLGFELTPKFAPR